MEHHLVDHQVSPLGLLPELNSRCRSLLARPWGCRYRQTTRDDLVARAPKTILACTATFLLHRALALYPGTRLKSCGCSGSKTCWFALPAAKPEGRKTGADRAP
jgi:hypothetical protein